MSSDYTPSPEVLQKYAEVLVNFALNSGEGVQKGEVVELGVSDVAKQMIRPLQNEVLKSGGHPMIRILPTGNDKDFYELANEEQLTFFPEKYLQAKVDLVDHRLVVYADPDPFELKDVDPAKIMKARDARKPYRDWLVAKEVAGNYTWTIGLWGVPAKAAEVGLSYEEYWEQIIKACFLDQDDPVAEWRQIQRQQEDIKSKLNQLEIDHLVVEGEDVQLTVKLGANRIWQGGSGRNIPSFEFFTSPDWRGVEGWIRFNQPVYRYGQMMKDVYLKFEKGVVAEAHAKVGQQLLDQMLKSPNADKAGEFSLTDKRMSRISHVMAETLYDENIGGPYGNTHLALGLAYKDCYRGDKSKVSDKEWEEMGYNNSPEHTDIVSTTDRTVTAHLVNGDQKVIYKDGQFVL